LKHDILFDIIVFLDNTYNELFFYLYFSLLVCDFWLWYFMSIMLLKRHW